MKQTSFPAKWLACAFTAGLVGPALLFAAEGSPIPAGSTPAAAPTTKTTSTSASTDAVPSESDKESQLLERFKKEENITNSLGLTLVWVPAGYRVGQCEVTQAEFEKVMGTNPSRFKGARRPVEQVSWTDAREFCRKLTEQEVSDGKLPKEYAYGLPTEQQWESYAAGTLLKDAITSHLGDRRNTENVGGLPANQFGLHDVRGNVWEWCSTPVARGGAWRNHEDFLDPGMRFVGTPDLRYDDIGFRIVLQGPGS